jgi:hypothetical protein
MYVGSCSHGAYTLSKLVLVSSLLALCILPGWQTKSRGQRTRNGTQIVAAVTVEIYIGTRQNRPKSHTGIRHSTPFLPLPTSHHLRIAARCYGRRLYNWGPGINIWPSDRDWAAKLSSSGGRGWAKLLSFDGHGLSALHR